MPTIKLLTVIINCVSLARVSVSIGHFYPYVMFSPEAPFGWAPTISANIGSGYKLLTLKNCFVYGRKKFYSPGHRNQCCETFFKLEDFKH